MIIQSLNSSGLYREVSPTDPFPVTGSFSATLSGFTPNGNVASRTVSTSSSNVALPAGTVVAVTNTGSKTAFITLSVGAGSAATTDMALPAGASIGLTVGSNTFINAITALGTTSLRIAGGAGLLSGFGGTAADLAPLGYQQITSLSAATALTVPLGTTVAIVTVETQGVRWRDDGTNPTASVGMPITAGQSYSFRGSAAIAAIKFIEQTASATLNVSYY